MSARAAWHRTRPIRAGVAVLGALAAALALAGCGGGDGAQHNSSNVATPADNATGNSDDDGPPVVKPTPEPGSTPVSDQLPRLSRWSIAGAVANYGVPGTPPSFSVTCDAQARQLVFYRLEDMDRLSGVAAFNLHLPSGSTGLRAFPRPDDNSGYIARMPLRQPWIDLLLASNETLETDLDGRAPMAIPVSPELKQLVSACRKAQ